MLLWPNIAVGVILTSSFSVPLVIIASNVSLREEPMTQLVINMTLVDFVFALLILATGLSDVVFAGALPPLCATLQYLTYGCAVACKAATFCLALDQFIAVAHSLRYNAIMAACTGRLVALSWLCVPLVGLLGLASYQLGLESSEAFDRRVLDVEHHIGQCHWMLNAHLFMVAVEALLLLLSLGSGLLFVYTAVQGARHEWRLHPNNRLFLRFKSFQRIVKVLVVVVVIDMVAAGVRIGSHWTAQLDVTTLIQQVRVLCLIVEGWTYGLTHPEVRSALSAFFGCRKQRVSDQVLVSEVQRPRAPSSQWEERAITEPGRF